MKLRIMVDYGGDYKSSGDFDVKVIKSEIPRGFIPKEAYGDFGRSSYWYIYTTAFMFDHVPCSPDRRRFAQVELRVVLASDVESDEKVAYVKYLGIDTRSCHFGALDEAMAYIDDLAHNIISDLNKKDIVSALSSMNFYGFINIYNGYSGSIDRSLELASQIFADYFSDEAKQDTLVAEQLTVARLRKALMFYNSSYMKP